MSFEQRKRVSIGVELASNPSILFLDEPTTGLDSRAAQSLIRHIRRIASSGRSIVCTIHQPSTAIFSAFDSLLLLRRGGETVFFGHLGNNCSNLVSFFESAPSVPKLAAHVNPATWMLDVIGAGTASHSVDHNDPNVIDFHQYYKQSSLHATNTETLYSLMVLTESSKKIIDELENTAERGDSAESAYRTSSWTQFKYLMHRLALTYWRSPNYSFAGIFVNTFVALIFSSAYPNQKYHDSVGVVSRSAVIYVTCLFCSILALVQVVPVYFGERPAFYREQQSRMYQVWIYNLTTLLVEIPGIILTSFAFTVTFFYIVGFDNIGNVTEKFFWYWLFQFGMQFVMMGFGQLSVAIAPNDPAAQGKHDSCCILLMLIIFFCSNWWLN